MYEKSSRHFCSLHSKKQAALSTLLPLNLCLHGLILASSPKNHLLSTRRSEVSLRLNRILVCQVNHWLCILNCDIGNSQAKAMSLHSSQLQSTRVHFRHGSLILCYHRCCCCCCLGLVILSVEYIRLATVHADTDVANPLKRMDDEVQKVFLLQY